ncbi:hypothetical protein PVK06_039589 [Gossypium arboreum]|uniref:Uncharacterized protein n=1 Tax=Gossypium arboreum TaxID=29729 RepID=A0ABR0N3A4_GOSAR|nr:hypothetical protein PVK06_039589 [Gossypium arboreum]
MSYYNQQQHPVGVPPPQGYPPKDAYPPPGYPAEGYAYPPPPQYQYAAAPPPRQQQETGFLEGWPSLGGRRMDYHDWSRNGQGGNRLSFVRVYALPDHRASTRIESPFYKCTTTREDMFKHLSSRGIRMPNSAYDFVILKRNCQLSNSRNRFILSLYLLEMSLPKRSQLGRSTSTRTVYFCTSKDHEPIIQSSYLIFHSDGHMFIWVRMKLKGSFGFPTRWSIPHESVCLHRQPIDSDHARSQYDRLRLGHPLKLDKFLIVRNIFHYCLEKQSPNCFRSTNQVLEAVGVYKIQRPLLGDEVWQGIYFLSGA